jgi:heat shock protein 5
MIEIESFFDGIELRELLTRERFEEMNMDLFRRTIPTVERALKLASLRAEWIRSIVLVGGSSRIPKIRDLVREFFNDGSTVLYDSIDPGEAVGFGAALQGGLLSGDPQICDFVLITRNPKWIGIEAADGFMIGIIPLDGQAPITKRRRLYTTEDYQREMRIDVYQGEDEKARRNHFLGRVVVRSLPWRLKEEVAVDVKFEFDEDEILTVTAEEPISHQRERIVIDTDKDKECTEGLLAY